MSEELGPIATVTHDGFNISSNEGTAKAIKDNLEAEPAPLDGSPEDAEKVKAKAEAKKRSEAASELGKAGGKAAAEARKAQDDLADEEEAPEAKEPEKEAPEDEEEPHKGNPRRDAKARIQQLARERAEERSKRVELEARLARLEAEKAAPAPKAPERTAAPEPGGKPQVDQYETYEQYVEALTDWKMEDRVQRMTKEAQERQRSEAVTKTVVQKVDKFNEQVKAAPDLMERVDPRLLDLTPSFLLSPDQTPGPQNDLAEEIVSSESSAALLVYLSEHEEEVRRILALPNAREIGRAVARLENRLAQAPIPPHTMQEGSVKQITYSQAKPPVQPLKTSASVAEDDVDDDTPFDKHYAIMQAKMRRAK